jgi:hypothetical protein
VYPYPVLNMLGRRSLGQQMQNQGPTTGGAAPGATPATYGCPWTPPPGTPGAEAAFPVTTDPNLNCMRDARGNTVCSDGMRYPPGCPKTPPPEFFSPGITPDVTTNGMIEGQVPPPKNQAAAPAAPAPAAAPAAAASGPGPSPLLLIGGGALGTAALATAAYFLFLKK